jgi:hypothetical protein
MQVTRTNPFTGEVVTREIAVTEAALVSWKSGTLIQEAMPNVSADDREFIMTGLLPEQWAAIFD